MSDIPSAADLVTAGLFARTTPAASVTENLGVVGSGTAERAFNARLMGGLDFAVIASRGFDIGDTYYRGIPLSWFSPVSDARALPTPSGDQWLSRFTGGLLTTCGLENIGPASAAGGLHGSFDHLPARDIRSASQVSESSHSVTLTASIESVSLFGGALCVHRTITSTVEQDGLTRLSVCDDVENTGRGSTLFSLLYHLNFGAPLVMPGTTVEIDASSTVARETIAAVPDWRALPKPTDTMTEAVFEHQGAEIDANGYAAATIENRRIGLRVDLAWSAETLPRLYQWVFPTRGRWALAIEPANAPLFGPDRDTDGAGAPMLAPGETRRHEIMLTISEPESVIAETAHRSEP